MGKRKEFQHRQTSHPNKPEEKFNWGELANAWGAPLVFRTEVKKFSGGLLHPRTMANLDSLGQGPGKILIGKRAAYRTDRLVAWMKKRYAVNRQDRGVAK